MQNIKQVLSADLRWFAIFAFTLLIGAVVLGICTAIWGWGLYPLAGILCVAGVGIAILSGSE